MLLEFLHIGDFAKTFSFLKSAKQLRIEGILNKYGQIGVKALADATPRRTGLTANSWTYDVKYSKDGSTLAFYNTNTNKGEKIALLLQYGHGTGTGGWVQGRDYINPALRSIFDKIADDAFNEITGKG